MRIFYLYIYIDIKVCYIINGDNMIDKIKVKINNKVELVDKFTTLEELAKKHEKEFKYKILLGKVNNLLKELNEKISEDSEIEFIDLTSNIGRKTYFSGLTYILIHAIRLLYGKKANIKMLHALDNGVYIETNFNLTKEKIIDIKAEIQHIVDQDLPIEKLNIDRLEAIKYFNMIEDYPKARLLNYTPNTYINLYRLENEYNYFYTLMPTSTGKINVFDLIYLSNKGFVLRYPTKYDPNIENEYHHHHNLFEVFKEFHDWTKLMHIETTSDLNKIVTTGKINDLIMIDETLQKNKLMTIAQEINKNSDKLKIVLIAGPSSSGKTTTSRKLCMYLNSFGLTPRVISMDDYFVEREKTPLLSDGTKDYETLDAVDLKLFDKQIGDLLSGKKVKVPKFNFISGKKEYKEEMYLNENDIIIIEGIHALNDKILTNIPRDRKYMISLSTFTEINIDNHNRISTTDNRLLRRILRDSRTRNRPVEDSLSSWHKVRDGEEKYIFPYQDNADIIVNSALIYEFGVLKTYVEPLLYSVPPSSPTYEDAKRLINILRLFLPMPADAVPEDSVLREFIGKSYFNAE